jgi:DNA processing protein
MALPNRDADWLNKPGHHIIEPASDDFPELLRQIPGPPERLYVAGNLDALHMPSLAIVGSRNPTRGGIQNAYEFAKHLSLSGFSIVSGLALGVDTAAHEGALDGGGMTVAFLGHGIDSIYPPANRDLAKRILARGAICSEFPIGSVPRPEHFPQRNRLISGLSLGTLVVEAAKRSGSLISARLAAEQGREIFAIPGSIHNPMARGCHQLIRQGAKLVESADDIVSELGSVVAHLMQSPEVSKPAPATVVELDSEYQELLNIIDFDPATPDELSNQSGLTIDQVSSMLLILELEGKIEAHAGGRYSKVACR